MGMATVTFPQGLETSNFFLRYYRPIRGNWWRKTFVIDFFQVEPYFSLTTWRECYDISPIYIIISPNNLHN